MALRFDDNLILGAEVELEAILLWSGILGDAVVLGGLSQVRSELELDLLVSSRRLGLPQARWELEVDFVVMSCWLGLRDVAISGVLLFGSETSVAKRGIFCLVGRVV